MQRQRLLTISACRPPLKKAPQAWRRARHKDLMLLKQERIQGDKKA